MAIKPDWTLGTLTLTAGSTAFTTTGSALKAADIQGGDTLMTQSGAVLVIETITGENSGTLYMPCPASAAGYDQPLRVRYQGDASRLPAATRDLINMLSSGNLSDFSQLQGDIDKVPYFLAPGVLGLIDLSSLGGGGTGKGAWNALVGTLAGRAAYNNEAEGFRVLVADNGNGQAVIYQKTGAGTVDWSMPIPFTGAKGNDGQPNKLTVGSVIEGDETRVTITGTPPNQFVNFVLRRGVKGETGDVTPAALAAKVAAEAAAEKTASDVVITGKDVEATAADRIATGKDAQATAADVVTTGNDAEATTADRIATGRDVEATAADRVATGKDAEATATAVVATGQDVEATAADRIATGKDAEATASDVVTTGRDVEIVTQAKEAVLRSESQAQEWANAPEGEEVKPGEFSARHWAKKAEHSAGGGVQSVNNKTDAHIVLDAADVGAAPTNHSHSDATSAAAGFMSAADKAKFELIPSNVDKTNTTSVGAALAAPTPATELVDGDKIGGVGAGGALLKTWSWATIKAGVKLFTDTLYASKGQGAKADTALQTLLEGSNITIAGSGSSRTISAIVPPSGVQSVNGKTDVDITLSAVDVGAAPTNHSHADATTAAAGFMSAADKTKLEIIPSNADKTNIASVGAALAAPTPSTAIQDGDKVAGIFAGGATLASWSWGAVKTWIKGWITKGDVGLSLVDNTSDANKPISTQQETALNLKLDKNAPAADSVKLNGKTEAGLVASGPIADAIAAAGSSGGGVGVNQTWQAVSRTMGTAFQNTTGNPIEVSITARQDHATNKTTITIALSSNGTNFETICSGNTVNTVPISAQFIVPPGHFYRWVRSGVTLTAEDIRELR